ncbi:MAG: SUKH-3 domain-containing protein [Alphaproteobacteria bacterium]|nr:SUKH-3 domain-containing protein [Alphaproteobacteria bacterium]
MNDFPRDVLDALRRAGWTSGRRDHDMVERLNRERVPSEHPAFATLSEFGTLALGDTGPGEQCARSDVQFDLILGGDENAARWAELLHTRLVGIGWTHNSHGELYMSEDGRVFENSIVHDAFCFLGADLAEALTRMHKGQRAKPMLRPEQAEIRLYGDAFGPGDPNLYDWQRLLNERPSSAKT